MKKLKGLIFFIMKRLVRDHKARRRFYRAGSFLAAGAVRVALVIALSSAFGFNSAVSSALCLFAFVIMCAARGRLTAGGTGRTIILPVMFFVSLGAITDILNSAFVYPVTLETLGYLLKISWYSFIPCLILGIFIMPARGRRRGLPAAVYKGLTVFLVCYFMAFSLYIINSLPQLAIPARAREMLAGGITAVWVASLSAIIASTPPVHRLLRAINNLFL